MASECVFELYEALVFIAGHPCDGQFPREPSLKYSMANVATDKIDRSLRRNFDRYSAEAWEIRPLSLLPSLDRHLASRREPPSTKVMDQILETRFWLQAAILLREAQDFMRGVRSDFLGRELRVSKTMIVQTFQHYILVCLGQGQIYADPWPLFEADYVDTNVPSLDMIRREWETARENYWDILMHDEHWLQRGADRRGSAGYQTRWQLGVFYQRSLLVQ